MKNKTRNKTKNTSTHTHSHTHSELFLNFQLLEAIIIVFVSSLDFVGKFVIQLSFKSWPAQRGGCLSRIFPCGKRTSVWINNNNNVKKRSLRGHRLLSSNILKSHHSKIQIVLTANSNVRTHTNNNNVHLHGWVEKIYRDLTRAKTNKKAVGVVYEKQQTNKP